jgi:hypothetical protein
MSAFNKMQSTQNKMLFDPQYKPKICNFGKIVFFKQEYLLYDLVMQISFLVMQFEFFVMKIVLLSHKTFFLVMQFQFFVMKIDFLSHAKKNFSHAISFVQSCKMVLSSHARKIFSHANFFFCRVKLF